MKQCDRTTIHKNLFFSLLLGEVIFLAGIERTADRIGCGVVAGLLHYLLLCAFMWMLLEVVLRFRLRPSAFGCRRLVAGGSVQLRHFVALLAPCG